jgi:4-amino-4-deoxy-L-arabinose transferase-like glycosyltransferase
VSHPRGGTRRFFWSPYAMVIVALAVRLIVMAFVYPTQLDPALDHKSFGYETGRVARSIATGQGFSSPYRQPTGPTALIPPLYTYLLAGVFKVFGVYTTASALVILTLNNLFSALTCLPVFLIARRIFGLRVAAWAGWAWAIFPYSVVLSNVAIWETTLTTLLLTAVVLATLKLERSRSIIAWTGYGLLWAAAALSSPTTLSTLPFLGAWIWLRHWRRGSNCTVAALAASFVFIIAVAPWVWRSSSVYGRFVPFRSGFGLDFLVGNSDDTSTPSNWKVLPADNPEEFQKYQLLGEPAYMAEEQRKAKAFIAQHPARFARETLRRVLFTWTTLWNWPPRLGLDDQDVPNVLMYSFVSLLAFVGIIWSSRVGKAGIVPLLIPLICVPLVYYVTHVDIRFRHPADPEVAIFMAYGAVSLRRYRARKVWLAHNQ